jgi:hypothetical protein
MLTSEALQQALQEASDGLEELSGLERTLTREEEKERFRLNRRQYVLSKIKEAKDKDRRDDEVYNTTVYEFLVPWGERHPFLMSLLIHFMKIKWGSGYTSVSIRDVGKVQERKGSKGEGHTSEALTIPEEPEGEKR